MGDLRRECDCDGECMSSGARHYRELADECLSSLQSVKKDFTDQASVLKDTVDQLKHAKEQIKELMDDAEESDRELLLKEKAIKGADEALKIIANKNAWLWGERDRLTRKATIWMIAFFVIAAPNTVTFSMAVWGWMNK